MEFSIRIRQEKEGVTAYVEQSGAEPGEGIRVGPGAAWYPEPYDVKNLPRIFAVLNELEAAPPSDASLRSVVLLMKDWHAKREAYQAALLAVNRSSNKDDAIITADNAQRDVMEADRVLVKAMAEVKL